MATRSHTTVGQPWSIVGWVLIGLAALFHLVGGHGGTPTGRFDSSYAPAAAANAAEALLVRVNGVGSISALTLIGVTLLLIGQIRRAAAIIVDANEQVLHASNASRTKAEASAQRVADAMARLDRGEVT